MCYWCLVFCCVGYGVGYDGLCGRYFVGFVGR